VMASVGSISSFPNFCTDTVILCNAACPLVMMPPKRVRRELSKSPTRGCPKSSWSGIQTASHEKPCLYKTGYLKVFLCKAALAYCRGISRGNNPMTVSPRSSGRPRPRDDPRSRRHAR